MLMRVILFDMFPAHGHYYGTFHFANLLRNAGFAIYYTCMPAFQEKVSAEGFSPYIINPFFILPQSIGLKEKGVLKFMLENLSAVFTNDVEKRIMDNVRAYDDMIETIRPDLVIIDEHYGYKPIFYWKYGIPLVTIQTTISPDYVPGVPPFTKPYIPDFSTLSRWYVEFLWAGLMVKNQIKRLAYMIITFGNTTEKYCMRYANKYGFPYRNIMRKRSVGVRFSQIPALIMPPARFDFHREAKSNLFFIGKVINAADRLELVDERLGAVFKEISYKKAANPDVRCIYCSLGTVTAAYLKLCRKFFRAIAKMCTGCVDIQMILSVGEFFDIAEIGHIPNNLYVFDHVPQLIVLQNCDFVITHGGMNTILESIIAEKPMLVFPLSPAWDQNGNAARVVFHGIGLKGKLRTASPKSILRLLLALIGKESEYKENIRFMKAEFEDEAGNILDLIDGFINGNNHVK